MIQEPMSEPHTLGQASSTAPSGGDYECLSPRQKQVCDLIVDGLTSKAIAERLGTTVHTIKAHRAEVMRKLNVESVADLVRTRLSGQAVVPAFANARESSAVIGTPTSNRTLRVVVIEDQPLFRDLLVNHLQSQGHDVRGLNNGQHLDALFGSHPPDVLILDVSLGCEENGLDIAEKVRRHSHCGIIFMSSHARVEDRVAAFNRGADAYFVKPVSFIELNAAMANLAQRLPVN